MVIVVIIKQIQTLRAGFAKACRGSCLELIQEHFSWQKHDLPCVLLYTNTITHYYSHGDQTDAGSSIKYSDGSVYAWDGSIQMVIGSYIKDVQ